MASCTRAWTVSAVGLAVGRVRIVTATPGSATEAVPEHQPADRRGVGLPARRLAAGAPAPVPRLGSGPGDRRLDRPPCPGTAGRGPAAARGGARLGAGSGAGPPPLRAQGPGLHPPRPA